MKHALCPVLFIAVQAAFAAPPAYHLVDTITIGGEGRWDYPTIDSAHHRLYLAHGGETEVIDTASGKLVGTMGSTPGVHGIAIAADLGLGLISNGLSNSVSIFDLATLKTVATVKVGANPDAIVYDPHSHRAVTFNGRSHDASVIDPKTARLLGTVPVGGKPEFAQVGDAGQVYFNVEDTGELAVLDPMKISIVQRHSLAPCTSPSGLAIDDQKRLYSVCENNMMVVSAADGTRVGQVPIGSGADGVVWVDGHAVSANGADGTLSVVKASPAGPLETIATPSSAPGARTIAADPGTGKIYLPTADFKPAEPGARRVALTGTFRVLVMAPN